MVPQNPIDPPPGPEARARSPPGSSSDNSAGIGFPPFNSQAFQSLIIIIFQHYWSTYPSSFRGIKGGSNLSQPIPGDRLTYPSSFRGIKEVSNLSQPIPGFLSEQKPRLDQEISRILRSASNLALAPMKYGVLGPVASCPEPKNHRNPWDQIKFMTNDSWNSYARVFLIQLPDQAKRRSKHPPTCRTGIPLHRHGYS